MASGANNTFRQVGIATGIAGLGTVFQTQIEHRTLTALGGIARRVRRWPPTAAPPSRAPWPGAVCARP